MSVAAVLLALAERCENEEGGWQLSVAIELAVTPGVVPTITRNPFRVRREADDISYNPPAYTTSIDAAAILVPPNYPWVLEVMCVTNLAATVYSDPDMLRHWSVFAKTPALALCAAALRARAAVAKEEG